MSIPTKWPNVREIVQNNAGKGEYISEFVIPIEERIGENFINIDIAVRYDIEDSNAGANDYAKKLAEDIKAFIIARGQNRPDKLVTN